MIRFIAEDIPLPELDENKIARWIKRTAAGYEKKTGGINYVFCSDKRILEVNKQYLQHDYYTDIITFDYSNSNILSGDIFISLDTVRSNAETQNVLFEEELKRIIIHGILHLCGQNDKSPEDKAEMTRKENLALNAYWQ